jgi:hypothetical protein
MAGSTLSTDLLAAGQAANLAMNAELRGQREIVEVVLDLAGRGGPNVKPRRLPRNKQYEKPKRESEKVSDTQQPTTRTSNWHRRSAKFERRGEVVVASKMHHSCRTQSA